MVFNSIIAIIVVWLTVLTVLVIRSVSHYNRLSDGITKAGLREVLEAILRTLHSVRCKVDVTEKQVDKLSTEGENHLHRFGIMRFNPFADTGGSQSFAISILNKKKNGIVMTSMYGRNGNRWYVKEIVAGKGKDIALSKEEESAIEQAV